MIFDWRTGDMPPGELEDAVGVKVTRDTSPRYPFWVDTETGELRYYLDPIQVDGPNYSEIAEGKLFLTPPITVWLYT